MTAASVVVDTKILTGTAAASGGTMTADYAIPASRVCRIEARAFLAKSTDPAVPLASLYAEGIYGNQGGTVSAIGAISGSTNPNNSTNLVGSRSMASNSAFIGGGAGPPTAIFSVSGTNARLTVTNNSDSAVAADVTVIFTVYICG